MAITTLLKLATILSITILPLLTLHTSAAFTPLDTTDIEDGEYYTVDPQARVPVAHLLASRNQPKKIKKGAQCNIITNNICNGIPVNNGTGKLQCCKKHCRNILGDRNNCGSCGKKCGFGELCCSGTCMNVAYDVNHCGKCNLKCPSGLKCEYGTCGYA